MKLKEEKLIAEIDYTDPSSVFSFSSSLQNSGFSIIKNHPIEWELISDLYKKWSAFFNSDEKFTYTCDPKKPEGFFPIEKQSSMGDMKECFYFYPWSSCPKYLYKTTISVYNNLLTLAEELLYWLIDKEKSILPKPIIKKIQKLSYSTGGALRILHYPELSKIYQNNTNSSSENFCLTTTRLIPHRDISLLTLLPVATKPGLELLDNYGEWYTIEPEPQTLIVNSGDMLSKLTSDCFKSTMHRVSLSDDAKEHPRYACAFFLTLDL